MQFYSLINRLEIFPKLVCLVKEEIQFHIQSTKCMIFLKFCFIFSDKPLCVPSTCLIREITIANQNLHRSRVLDVKLSVWMQEMELEFSLSHFLSLSICFSLCSLSYSPSPTSRCLSRALHTGSVSDIRERQKCPCPNDKDIRSVVTRD